MSTTETKTPLAQLAGAAYIRASHDATTWFNVDAEAIRQAAQFYADMLEALEAAVDAISELADFCELPSQQLEDSFPDVKEAWDKISAAIAKARGKE